MERNTRWDIGIAMTWFDILKENRLVSQNITHTKVDENKPEQSDDRCKEALKKIIRQLENFYSYGDNSQRLLVKAGIRGNTDKDDAQAFSLLIEEIDSCPEEICCDILEQFERLRQEGKNWMNNLQNAILEDEWQADISNHRYRDVENFRFQYDHNYSEYEGENKVKLGTFFEEQYTDINERNRKGLAFDFADDVTTRYGLVLAVILAYNEKRVTFHLRYSTKSLLKEQLQVFSDTPIIAIQNVAYGAVEDIIMTIGPGAGMI
jgi:hypothetical protein